MRIFLSYGHDIYASLAERIKHDLEALNHDVWFDRLGLIANRLIVEIRGGRAPQPAPHDLS